jgi:hypothetical protein
MRQHAVARVVASLLGATVVVAGLRLIGVIQPIFISSATISAVQRAAIGAYAARHEEINDAHVGCPVDVLAARKTKPGVVAYTVVHCWTGDSRCRGGDDFTIGVVAHLTGGVVRSAGFDDAIDYQGEIDEAKIFPTALRQRAIDLMDSDGPSGYDVRAKVIAGC